MSTKKSLAAFALTAGVVVAAWGPFVEPSADAGQTGPVPMTVSTTIAVACTATAPSAIPFGNYTTGQSAPLNTFVGIEITCPTSSALSPEPVTLQFQPVITGTASGYEMSKGGTGAAPFLTYKLCDTSCATGTVYGNNTPGPSISIISGTLAQNYELYAQIPGAQTPTASATAYSQRVNAYINY
jgi:spore coat protein U-like protein